MTKRAAIAVAAALLLVLAVWAGQAHRLLTPQEVDTLQAVDDPQLSPDGRQVVYVVTTIAVKADRRLSHLWMVPADGVAEA